MNLSYTTVSEVMQGGASVRRTAWPECKKIRLYKESDADFFQTEFDTSKAIICECEKPCDCKISVWVPEEGDKESADWEIING